MTTDQLFLIPPPQCAKCDAWATITCDDCHAGFCLAHIHLAPKERRAFCTACGWKEIRAMMWKTAKLTPRALLNLPRFLWRSLKARAWAFRFNRLAQLIVGLDWLADRLSDMSKVLVAANGRLISWNLTHSPKVIQDMWHRDYIATAHADDLTARITHIRVQPDGTRTGYVEVFPPDGPSFREPLPGDERGWSAESYQDSGELPYVPAEV